MPRLLNVQISDKKRVVIGLTYIPGIGLSRAKFICKEFGISDLTYMSDLTKNQVSKLSSFIRQYYKIGPKIHFDTLNNIRDLIKISSYRGLRHFKGLPLRGQRTKTNSRTSRRIRRKL
jgi:small subunit ribosomal protein S13